MKIPAEALSDTALLRLIEGFILREGTDYGHLELALDKKVEEVRQQLIAKKAVIVFDESTQSVNIVSTTEPELSKRDGPDVYWPRLHVYAGLVCTVEVGNGEKRENRLQVQRMRSSDPKMARKMPQVPRMELL